MPSVGSVGDSCDNALAETIIGLYKTEQIYHEGPWKGIDHVEYQTFEWVDWFNMVRLLEPIGDIPPIEFENLYYQRQTEEPAMVVGNPREISPVNPGGFSLPQTGESILVWNPSGSIPTDVYLPGN